MQGENYTYLADSNCANPCPLHRENNMKKKRKYMSARNKRIQVELLYHQKMQHLKEIERINKEIEKSV